MEQKTAHGAKEEGLWGQGKTRNLSVLPRILVTPDGVLDIFPASERGGRQQATYPPQEHTLPYF